MNRLKNNTRSTIFELMLICWIISLCSLLFFVNFIVYLIFCVFCNTRRVLEEARGDSDLHQQMNGLRARTPRPLTDAEMSDSPPT